MSVFVDELRPIRSIVGMGTFMARCCHMMADTPSELEDMRRALQLKAAWRDGDHYDLAPSKRDRAIQLGAVETSAKQLVLLRRRNREKCDA